MLTVTAGAQPWQPPEPEIGGWDWIRFGSGEWLGGELKSLRDLDLEFESDELDLLQLDWDDVAELRSPRLLTYRFDDDLGVYTGTAVMRDGTIAIETLDGVQEMPRDKLILIIAGRPSERSYWSGKASLGLVARSGNTDQSDLNAAVHLRRQTLKSRLSLDYQGNYGQLEGTVNTKNHNGTVALDMLITAGFFVTPVSVNLFNDEFQNIELKTTVGAGVGYDVLRGGDLEWSVGLGGGYQVTNYASVPAGEDDKDESAAIIPSTQLDWDITDDLEFLMSYSAQIGVPDVENTYHHGRVAFSFEVVGDLLDLDLGLHWDRVETPRRDADGNVPVRDDFRTTVSIGLDF